jgi:hypothetical protein
VTASSIFCGRRLVWNRCHLVSAAHSVVPI